MYLPSPVAWLRRHTWIRRALLTTTFLWFVGITVGAGAAVADGFSGSNAAGSLISWTGLSDTHGVPVSGYQISGPSGKLDPRPEFFVSMAQACFDFYRFIAVIAIWFIDWITSFEWFSLLSTPAVDIGGKFSMMLSQVHVEQAFMAIAALAALIAYGLGKRSTAVYELCATWVIAALAAGMLANPLSATSGDNGWIMQTRAGALEMAGAMITPVSGEYVLDTRTGKAVEKPEINTSTDTAALQKQLTGKLVDTFVRQPAQLVNYGKVLDKGPCESVYTEASKNGPYADNDTVMNKINDCDKNAAEFAKHPSPSQALAAIAVTPAAFILLFLAILIAGGIISSVAIILWKSISLLWSRIQALLPGGARAGFMLDLGEMIAAFILMFFSIFCLAIYIAIISAIFDDGKEGALMKTFVEADIALLVLLHLYRRQKARIQASAARIAAFLGKRPGGSAPVKAPSSGWTPGRAALGAVTASRLLRRNPAPTPHDPNPTNITHNNVNIFGAGAGAGSQQQNTPYDDNTTVTQMPDQAPRQSAAARLAMITGKVAGQAALGHATGHLSTAAIAAMRVRRAALAAKAAHAAVTAREDNTAGVLPAGPRLRALGPGPTRPRPDDTADSAAPRTTPPRSPRPGGGGLFGFLRGRGTSTGYDTGYQRVRTASGAQVLVSQPNPTQPGTGLWSRLRRRG